MKLTRNLRIHILKYIISVIVILCISIVTLPSNTLADDKVQIAYDGITVDSFCGVPSIYLTGTRNTDTGTYCCAQYVKNFYSAVYGANIFNLLPNQTPVNSNTGNALVQIDSPQPGDIGYQNTSSGLWHWFIVKSVNGDTATIIEQNWKWSEGGATYTSINRTVSPSTVSSLKYFRLSYDQIPAGQTIPETVTEEIIEETIAETEYYEETIASEAYVETAAAETISETAAEQALSSVASEEENTVAETAPIENSSAEDTVAIDDTIADEPLLETKSAKLSQTDVDAISSAHPNSNSLEMVAGFSKLSDTYNSTSLAKDSLRNTISFCLVRNTLDLQMNKYSNLSDRLGNTSFNLAQINSTRNCILDGSIIQHFELAFAADSSDSLIDTSIQLAFR